MPGLEVNLVDDSQGVPRSSVGISGEELSNGGFGAALVNSEAKSAVNQRHNRSNNVITNVWPGDDTFSVSWTQAENVRRYRILVTGGADGDHVRVVEDAVNEVQAEVWLAETLNSVAADVEYFRVFTSQVSGGATLAPRWSEWQELSKDVNGLSLGRLDFIASAAGPFSITVEAE